MVAEPFITDVIERRKASKGTATPVNPGTQYGTEAYGQDNQSDYTPVTNRHVKVK